MNFGRVIIAAVMMGSLSACQHHQEPVGRDADAKPVTDVDPVQATPEYWYDQPANVHVPARDYDRLFAACQKAAHGYFFKVDRTDYREGVITTHPNTSAQFFELWRPDNSTYHDIMQSSLGTMRRTIRIEIEPQVDGSFLATPKVLVERETVVGRRVTAVVKYRESMIGNAGGSPETALMKDAAVKYWYAVGRDPQLERRVADSILENLY